VTGEADAVNKAKRGDAAAWEAIVLENQQPVFRLAYLLLGDADDAEDVAQEAFIRAYAALGRFDAGRPIRPWLLRIAANLARNWRRSAGRYLFALQRLLRNELPSPAPHQQAEQNLEDRLLWEAIRKLNRADQQVIYLRYFLECSENEAADVLDVPAGTVKSRLHRAIARLRVVLQEQYPEWTREGK